ncbi:uncharacterized protein LOC119109356 [Pollicipes pollicipes]|uniref:uncharacterized protein LOC119109356 n=1 Tax=Pollicipes pollicipes TaxID=41117 RepID=UPI001885182E|nr:uncharacterized protein LOC119109356 [Pollicipes pollicipes]
MEESSLFSELSLRTVGFRGSRTHVEDYCSADATCEPDAVRDRAVLTIPYSNTSFRVTVLLNAEDRGRCPDFIFDDASFLADCDVDELERRLPALRCWRPDALPDLLCQLLAAYKVHVAGWLAPNGRLQAEYSRLLEALGADALEPMVAAHEPRPALFVAPVCYRRVALRFDDAVAELLLDDYPRRVPTLCLSSTTARPWRREVAVDVPEEADVAEVVRAVTDEIEELLRTEASDSDSVTEH